MIPVAFTGATRVLLIAAGEAGEKRRAFLEGGGAALTLRGPADAVTDEEIANAQLVFVAGLAREAGERLAARARHLRVPVNVEDENDLCDFHVPSLVRRGGLTLALSTGGESPALAVALRQRLERLIGPEWGERLAMAASLRRDLRAQGLRGAEISRAVLELAAREGWFDGLDLQDR